MTFSRAGRRLHKARMRGRTALRRCCNRSVPRFVTAQGPRFMRVKYSVLVAARIHTPRPANTALKLLSHHSSIIDPKKGTPGWVEKSLHVRNGKALLELIQQYSVSSEA
jgi:hypothetical protein